MNNLAMLLMLLPVAASAATITVNTTADNLTAGDRRCTLREAITNVNAAADTTGGDCGAGSGAGDTITFSLKLPAIIKLVHGELAIAQNVRIIGPGSTLLVIDGRYRTRVFRITAGTTAMSDLTIQKGALSSRHGSKGGGVLVDVGASFDLSNSRLLGNKAATSYGTNSPTRGAGIAIDGSATLTNCTISGNGARGGRAQVARGGGIAVAGNATLTHCTLTGNTANHGGGILVDGSATLTDCTLTGNTANHGGGVLIDGSATLTDCTISGNTATSSGYRPGGAGIAVTGTATLTNCMISGNTGGNGGGMENEGNATLTHCTLSGNTGKNGGGFDNSSFSATATLTHCTLSGNTGGGLGGGMENKGNATLTDCTLSGNSGVVGGGLDNYYYATVTLTNCTISGNTGRLGGGIYSTGGATLIRCAVSGHELGLYNDGGFATLTNCTISGNGIGLRAGDYNSRGATTALTNCTFSGNGHGLENYVGTTTLTNTIVANSGPTGNCAKPVTSGGYNLSSDSTCFNGGGNDLLNTPPILAPFGNYGGPTDTVALCTGPGSPVPSCTAASPAIDAGVVSVTGPPGNLTTDQRGLPRLSGAHVDIGAYEVQRQAPPPTPTATATLISAPTHTATNSPTRVPTQTPTQAPTTSVTASPTASPSATPTNTAALCAGDCDGSGAVAVDELIPLVNIALGTADASACPLGIPTRAEVDITLIIQAVNNALNGCPAG